MRRYSFIPLSLVLALPATAQQQHPTAENLQLAVTTTVSKSDTVSGDPALDRLARQLRGLRVVAQVGGETGVGGADFGLITSMTVDAQGRMLIMDNSDKSISRWTAGGQAAGRFGRNGGGPLEFQWPQGLAIAGNGDLIAGDLSMGLKRIRWDSVPVLQEIWGAGQTVGDFCVGGTTTAVQRFDDDGTVVQLLDAKGTRIRGFGDPYRSPFEFVKRVLSEHGLVACLPGGVIASTSTVLPYIRFWSATGAPLSTVRLAQFVPMSVTTTEEGGVMYSNPPNGYERFIRLVPVGGEHLLAQVAYHSRESNKEHAEFATLHSYLIRIRDGRSVYLGTTLPIIAAAPLPKVYGWRNDPVPEAVILQ